ncbi:conserved Plasmodium protein, unknown function [Plasmodium berghei]|uniref:Uncharacterized protein n=2 Tax=Plasmodium berghei TaxID=5821 RepID=A0A509AIN8_PLABA|nr:conserved protein, unknown function [Plasmodium berghei ANKA]CXI25514.1 conserved Plasmodium protein, unknown function [Plasmodium berghei]SCM20398.1 conserved Plasmodium protein, unknown function [Plasmodium berghei]SCN23990.1 conserved Plasmodium protein, unknown function [Plasmodium berghei]SCO59344.1 conserved Plasmodium protein, unknown function [Plasmodium berghei]SCO60447.1 conserved Plasmodium protein, unknown function [Plasmodium berghei]|eukprot:XP_034420881.1 conserved protein, unknown function [Plasmodium berghei ANKA]
MQNSREIKNVMKYGKLNRNNIFSDIVKKINKILSYKKENRYIDNINDKYYIEKMKNVKENYNMFKKNITNIPGFMIYTRNYRTIKNKNPKLKKYVFINKKNGKLPFLIYKNYIDNNHEIIDKLVTLVNKYEREINFFKYTFIFNGALITILLVFFIYIFNSDFINSYIVKEVDKIVNEIKNSKKIQNNIKEVIENILYIIVKEEQNKQIASEFFVNVLSRSKGQMNELFIKMFEEKEIKDMFKNTALELSTYISNNNEIQKNIYQLITKSMYHPEAIRISTNWLNNIFKSENVTQHVRNVIYKEIFSNNEMKGHSINYMQNILLNVLESANSKEIVKLFFLSILSNPDFQNELSESLWKIFKLAVSPKWMNYDDIKIGLLNVKENKEISKNKDSNTLHIITTNCDEKKFKNNISGINAENYITNKFNDQTKEIVSDPNLNKIEDSTNALSNNMHNGYNLKNEIKDVLQFYEQLNKEPNIIQGISNKIDVKMNKIGNNYNEDNNLYFSEKNSYLFSLQSNSLLYIAPTYKVYDFNKLIKKIVCFQYMKIIKTDDNFNSYKKYSEENDSNVINNTLKNNLKYYTFKELANLFIVDTLLFYSHKYYFYYYYVDKFKNYFLNFRKYFIQK